MWIPIVKEGLFILKELEGQFDIDTSCYWEYLIRNQTPEAHMQSKVSFNSLAPDRFE